MTAHAPLTYTEAHTLHREKHRTWLSQGNAAAAVAAASGQDEKNELLMLYT